MRATWQLTHALGARQWEYPACALPSSLAASFRRFNDVRVWVCARAGEGCKGGEGQVEEGRGGRDREWVGGEIVELGAFLDTVSTLCLVCLYCMHVYMYCMYVCMYTCMYVYMHVRMHVRMHACMYACMHVCMYACMHIHTRHVMRFVPRRSKGENVLMSAPAYSEPGCACTKSAALKDMCHATKNMWHATKLS